MPNNDTVKKFHTIQKEISKKYKDISVFIAPNSVDPQFEKFIPKYNKRLEKAYKQSTQLFESFFELIKLFPNIKPPAIVEAESNQINPNALKYLHSQYILQQILWQQLLPNYAVYALEFFLPPLTPQKQARLDALGKEIIQPASTVITDMPFALKKDESGEFDAKSTIEFEKRYHLIASKLQGMAHTRLAWKLMTKEAQNFPAWAFFAVHQAKEIKIICQQIVQVVFDNVMLLSYQQAERGIDTNEAKQNAYAQLVNLVNKKELGQLIVHRAVEDMPLENYVLLLLSELRQAKPHIKPETFKDFYKHLFISLVKIIRQNLIFPDELLEITLREATQRERSEELNSYTAEAALILPSGNKFESVKEYYKIVLSQDSIQFMLEKINKQIRIDKYFT